jgi:hypothetical protein
MWRSIALLVIAAVVVPGLLFAQPAGSSGMQRDPTWETSSRWTFSLFPSGDVFPVYVADPHRPTNAIVPRFYFRNGIDDTSSPRAWLSAGGRFGILRMDTPGPGRRSWQVGIEAGLDAVFDTQNRSDGIGWDGNYGLTVTTASRSPWAFKVAILHISAHLGDEHSQRTGLVRVDYTREELALGTAWRFHPRWRLYGEVAVGYILRNDDQEPWRAQGGLEFESGPRLWGGRFAWYSAADFGLWEERGWRLDTTLQGGLVTRANGRTYRLLVEYLDGRPQIGEFFKNTEASLGLGFRIDL